MVTLSACEEIALHVCEVIGQRPDEPAAPGLLCERLTGSRPERVPDLPRESLMTRVGGRVRIMIRHDVPPPRARFLCLHEIAHTLLDPMDFLSGAELEESCDMLAACMLAPRPAFLAMVSRFGHSVYDLAHALECTQAMAMLRIGETTGRPVRLLAPKVRTRGEAFDWPESREALRGLHKTKAHPIRLADEGRWGLMAR